MEARYNLRSTSHEDTHIPVELQLAGDGVFLSQTLGASHPEPGQVTTFQSESTSETDSEGSFVEESSSKIRSPVKNSGSENLVHAGRSAGPSSGGGSHSVGQEYINNQILKQLSQLNDRLASIEQRDKTCKKSVDKSKIKNHKKSKPQSSVPVHGGLVPPGLGGVSGVTHPTIPPQAQLRHDSEIQQQVQERLRHLADNLAQGNEKIKSQRGGGVDVYVKNRVRWPHEFVLTGTNKERVTYDQLSPVQWMTGFCRTMRDQMDVQTREFMLDYLINLLEDANDFSWATAKASHAVLLCRMEQGEIKNWSEVDKIDRIRRAHAQRHVTTTNVQGHKLADKGQNGGKTLPCVYYNKNTCLHKSSHETKGIFYKHVCASCFTKEGKSFVHPQMDCRKFKSKNE